MMGEGMCWSVDYRTVHRTADGANKMLILNEEAEEFTMEKISQLEPEPAVSSAVVPAVAPVWALALALALAPALASAVATSVASAVAPAVAPLKKKLKRQKARVRNREYRKKRHTEKSSLLNGWKFEHRRGHHQGWFVYQW